jgi:hypothetical protein
MNRTDFTLNMLSVSTALYIGCCELVLEALWMVKVLFGIHRIALTTS